MARWWINETEQMRIDFNILKSNIGLIILTIFFWTLSNYVFHFDGLYGQDSYEYLRYTKALSDFIHEGCSPGDYFWPLYYPIAGSLLSFIWLPSVSLQLISLFSFFVIVKYSSRILDLLYPKNDSGTLFIALFFMLCPMAFRLSLCIMSDMLAVAFIITAFYNGILYLNKQTIIRLGLSVLLGMSAVMTRYASIVVLMPLGILILSSILKNKKHLKYVPVLLALSILLILPHLVIRSHNTTGFLHHDWLKGWSVSNFFKNDFHFGDGNSHYFWPNIVYVFLPIFDPRYFFAGIFLAYPLFKTWKTIAHRRLFVFSFLLYALFLAGIPYQNNRYLFLSFPVILLLFFPAFNWVIAKFKHRIAPEISIIAVMICQIVLCYLALKPILERNAIEREIGLRISLYQTQTLYSFDIDVALQGRGLKFEYHNLWTQEYASFRENALVLFHPTKFEQKWKGQNLMLNWESLKRNYNLRELANLPEGWVLYQIKKK